MMFVSSCMNRPYDRAALKQLEANNDNVNEVMNQQVRMCHLDQEL